MYPKVSSKLKSKDVYASSSIPKPFNVSSPKTKTLKACWISKAPGSAASIFATSSSLRPFSINESLLIYGELSNDIDPIT